MKFGTLIRRSLRFHWRSHLGVVLGAAIGSAALSGALVVGDSVKESLKDRALKRLGWLQFALDSGDRCVSDRLAQSLNDWLREQTAATAITNRESSGTVSSMFRVNAVVTKADGTARANRVNLYQGIPPHNWRQEGSRWAGFDLDQETLSKIRSFTNEADIAFAARYFGSTAQAENSVYLNESLARQLGVKADDEILIRVAKPTALSAELVVAQRSDSSLSIRLPVRQIVSDAEGGDFSLETSQTTPLNAFVSRKTMADLMGQPSQPNILGATWLYEDWPAWAKWPVVFRNEWLRSKLARHFGRKTNAMPVQSLNLGLSQVWTLEDAQAQLKAMTEARYVEQRSRRIFLDPPIVAVALAADKKAQPILTYLATLLRFSTNATPYSMVTAAGGPWTPADLRDDEIVVSQWLADDLKVKPGDEIAMSYFLPESGAKLEEATNSFRVHSIVPMEMPWADRTLMPDFPGIEKAESTSEWDAGFPLTYKVRLKDDEYWKQHRGTPKAFITLAAGQRMWGSRFGNLTAIRFPMPTNSVRTSSTSSQTQSVTNGDVVERVPTSVEEYRATLEKKILANLKPEELGLRFEPVRKQALKAAEESQDFGGLFLGFSFFLIVAALLLMALLFQLGLEQRAPEIGTFLAVGFTPKQVRNLLLREGVALAFVGGVLGTIGGLCYAKAMLRGLTTIWRDAVGNSALNFHFTGQTLAIGLFASVIVSVVTIWLSLRKFVKRPARELLVGEIGNEEADVRSLGSTVFAAGALLSALGLVGFAAAKGDTTNAGIFFGAGALVLVAGLSFANAWFKQLGGAPVAKSISGNAVTLGALALRGSARRRKRSLSTVAMLACGSFLIVSIGVFRLDANRDATEKISGTGGFALIGETTMPVVHDLNSQAGREFFALDERNLNGVSFVPFRVREGDEASCLNLNAAQKPRLLGVKPEMLWDRFAFTRSLNETTKIGPWASLEKSHLSMPLGKDEVPAIGDANSIQWAMRKKVGDTIDYVDERGQPFKVRIVGAVANSILQGQLIIDEAEFVKRFPGESGYRTFLIDAPSNTLSQVSATLSRAMQDVGLELTPAAQRLAQFNAVQNTYLGTFQVLGGLGLLLGSAGLGIVVLRNVLERRGELALLMAVGFRKPQVQQLLLMENAALLAAGLTLGVIAAAVAVVPALMSPGSHLPMASLGITLSAVLINGALWTWAATRLALRGDLLGALRNE